MVVCHSANDINMMQNFLSQTTYIISVVVFILLLSNHNSLVLVLNFFSVSVSVKFSRIHLTFQGKERTVVRKCPFKSSQRRSECNTISYATFTAILANF